MPAGDGLRVWFPEMIEQLERSWSKTTTWDELVNLCSRMSERRKEIRRERGIEPPKMRCPKCGKTMQAEISGVSIRSALFVLKNNAVITDDEFKNLDKSWMRHKKQNYLDGYGGPAKARSGGKPSVTDPCGDGNVHARMGCSPRRAPNSPKAPRCRPRRRPKT